MREALHGIEVMMREDPAAVLGFLLIGASGFLFIHMQFKLRAAGEKADFFAGLWSKPNPLARYLSLCASRGWSRWPAYLVWPSLVIGIALLMFGLFHLQD